MTYQGNQFPNGVGEAVSFVKDMVHAKRETCGEDTRAAIEAVARDCRVSPATVRKFIHPSRHPKDVGVGVWGQIWRAYRQFLLGQIERLEQDLRRVESLGNIDPGTAQDLRVEAEALIARLKQNL